MLNSEIASVGFSHFSHFAHFIGTKTDAVIRWWEILCSHFTGTKTDAVIGWWGTFRSFFAVIRTAGNMKFNKIHSQLIDVKLVPLNSLGTNLNTFKLY